MQCTFSGNTALLGGGISSADGGSAALTHCTFSLNNATGSTLDTGISAGGGLFTYGKDVTLTHCLLAGNTAGNAGGADLNVNRGTLTRSGANLVPGAVLSSVTSQSGPAFLTDTPLLAPQGSYGGPTKTMALLPGSPARNAASVLVTAITSDQRGFAIVGLPDIGAYEAGTLGSNYLAYIWETLPTAGNGTLTDPLHASTYDFDGDGATNGDEWLALTNATDPNSRFAVTLGTISGGNLPVSFSSALGRTYTIETTTDFASWTPVPGPFVGTGGTINTGIGPVTGVPKLFLRVRVALAP